MATLGLPLDRGRLVTDDQMRAADDIWAVGDAAAIPDVTRPSTPEGTRPVTSPTAQHAQRQGNVVAYNIAASLGRGRPRRYRHKDLGLVADLGGSKAVAKPLGVPLTGRTGKAIARGYHLYALPCPSNRVRVLTGWLLSAALPPQSASLAVVRDQDALIAAAQATDIYPGQTSDELPGHAASTRN
jgi:NADH dehydrogenase